MCRVQAAVTKYKEYKEVCLLNDARVSTPTCNITTASATASASAVGQQIQPTSTTCPRTHCDPGPTDVLSHFYGKWHDFSCQLLPAEHVARQAAFLTGPGAAAGATDYFLEKRLAGKKGDGGPYTRWTRSFVPLGSPLRGFKSRTDEPGLQVKKVMLHLGAIEQRLWDVFGRAWDQFPGSPYNERRWDVDGLEVRFYGVRMYTIEIMRYMNEDL